MGVMQSRNAVLVNKNKNFILIQPHVMGCSRFRKLRTTLIISPVRSRELLELRQCVSLRQFKDFLPLIGLGPDNEESGLFLVFGFTI